MSSISKQALKVENSTSFPDNNTGYITPSLLRAFNVDMIDSTVNQASYSVDIAAIQSEITALEAFTASQQPSFAALNSFTASQIVTNNALNAFTQSAGAEIDSLSAFTGSIQNWTSSIVQIQSNGTVLGNSVRLNLVGPGTFFSASLVQNVNGPIATLTFTSDNAKVNTSSFNDYTASVSSSQAALSASVSQSIYALNQYTASEEGQINPFTASVNAYTASNDAKWDNIAAQSGSWIAESETGSFAILGANQIFTGNNTFVGNTVVSQSAAFGTASFNAPVNIYNGIASNLQLSGSLTSRGNLTLVNNSDLFLGGDPYSVYNGIGLTQQNGNYAMIEYGSSSAIFNFGVVDANAFSYSTELLATATQTGIVFEDFNMGNFSYNTFLTLPQNNGANPAPVFNRGIVSSGSFVASGSVIITGSTYGNVISASISSTSASIDLSRANYFTLTLVSGSTHINVLNPKPGNTAILRITTAATASVTFSPNVLQPTGSIYVPTTGNNNIDILTFTAFDTSSVYVISATQFS